MMSERDKIKQMQLDAQIERSRIDEKQAKLDQADFAEMYKSTFKQKLEDHVKNCPGPASYDFEFETLKVLRVAKKGFEEMEFTAEELHTGDCDYLCECERHYLKVKW